MCLSRFYPLNFMTDKFEKKRSVYKVTTFDSRLLNGKVVMFKSLGCVCMYSSLLFPSVFTEPTT